MANAEVELDLMELADLGQPLKLAINGSNDAGSGAWTDVGFLNVTITWLGF